METFSAGNAISDQITDCGCGITDTDINGLLANINNSNFYKNPTDLHKDFFKAINGIDVSSLPIQYNISSITMPHIVFDTAAMIAWKLMSDKLENDYKNSCVYKRIISEFQSEGYVNYFDFEWFFESNIVRRSISTNLWGKVVDTRPGKRNKEREALIIENQILKALTRANDIFSEELNRCSCEVYNKLGGTNPCPNLIFATVGDGGDTTGISGTPNKGIRFFDYKYFRRKTHINPNAVNHILTRFENDIIIKCPDDNQGLIFLPYFGAEDKHGTIIKFSTDQNGECLYLINKFNDAEGKQRWETIIQIKDGNEIVKYPGWSLIDKSALFVTKEDYEYFDEKIIKHTGLQSLEVETKNTTGISLTEIDTLNGSISWVDNFGDEIAFFNPDLMTIKVSKKLCNSKMKIIGVLRSSVDEITVKVIQATSSPITLENPIKDIFSHLYFDDNKFVPEPDNNDLPGSTLIIEEDTKILLKHLALSPDIKIEATLLSRGIGEEKSDLHNGLNVESFISKSSDQSDRGVDKGSNANYPQRRYSFSKLKLFPGHLEIYIEAYVSPLRCTWGDSTHPFSLYGNLTALDFLQNYAIGSPKIYNHVLSGLRTLGTLEYIIGQLQSMAVEMTNSGGPYNISDSQKDDLIIRISKALSDSSVVIFDKDENNKGQITYPDYRDKIK